MLQPGFARPARGIIAIPKYIRKQPDFHFASLMGSRLFLKYFKGKAV